MIDFKSLWIGEELRLLSNGAIGTFEGVLSDGNIKIKLDGVIRILNPLEVEMAPENHETPVDLEDSYLSEPSPKKSKPFKNQIEIDLHIEKLAPHLIHGNKERILSYQLEKFREFMAQHLNSKQTNLLIIHGKGEGILREQIRSELKSISRVRFFFPVNKDGATEVWLD
jgi:dsDNA-specific endonuclease/ATPase MutS2